MSQLTLYNASSRVTVRRDPRTEAVRRTGRARLLPSRDSSLFNPSTLRVLLRRTGVSCVAKVGLPVCCGTGRRISCGLPGRSSAPIQNRPRPPNFSQ